MKKSHLHWHALDYGIVLNFLLKMRAALWGEFVYIRLLQDISVESFL